MQEHGCHTGQCHYISESKILHANTKLIELGEIEHLIEYIYKDEQKHIDACNYENRLHFEHLPDTIKYADFSSYFMRRNSFFERQNKEGKK